MLLLAMALSSVAVETSHSPVVSQDLYREISQPLTSRMNGQRPPIGNRMNGERSNPVDRILAEGDSNKDGKLSRDELNALRIRVHQLRKERHEIRQERRQNRTSG